MPMTVSVSSGRGDGKHNTRVFIAENVDESRIKDDVIFVNQSLPDAYRQCFGDACEISNRVQVRKDRMLTPEAYLKKIEASQGKKNTPKPFYESVIQVGNKDDAGILSHPEMAQRVKEVLVEYAQGFQKRNPNLHVFCEVLHMDEATPHLHIDWIPVAGGYRKGMPLRNSLEKAMNQQGLAAQGRTDKHNNGRAVWQDREKDFLVSLCREHGLEASWERHEISEKKLSVADFKKLSRINERMAVQKLSELENLGLIDRLKGKDKDLLTQASEALGKQISANYKALGKERERLRIRSEEVDASAASIKAAEADLEQQRDALENQRQQMEEQARLNQLALDNQRRAIQQEREKAEKIKAEAEKDKADAEEARREAAEKADQAISDKSLAETLTRQLKADKAAWEADKKTWKTVEEANKAQREVQAALDKAVKDGQAALDKANQESQEKLDEANRTAKNNLDWYHVYKKRFLDSEKNADSLKKDVKSLTEELAASKTKINEMQEKFDGQVKDLTDEIDDRKYTIQLQEDYITSLRNECWALNNILDEKRLTIEEEGQRRAYKALSEESRTAANIAKRFDGVDPTEEFLQQNIQDVKRERNRNRSRERSRGMER